MRKLQRTFVRCHTGRFSAISNMPSSNTQFQYRVPMSIPSFSMFVLRNIELDGSKHMRNKVIMIICWNYFRTSEVIGTVIYILSFTLFKQEVTFCLNRISFGLDSSRQGCFKTWASTQLKKQILLKKHLLTHFSETNNAFKWQMAVLFRNMTPNNNLLHWLHVPLPQRLMALNMCALCWLQT